MSKVKLTEKSCAFKFEKGGRVWASGDRKETERMRIQKTHADGTVETYSMVKIEPTNPDEVFFKSPNTENMEVIHLHLASITGRSSPQYYEIRQSFHQSKSCSDALGGYCSGKFWQLPVANEKFATVLDDFCKKGYKQVPYMIKQK